MIILKPESRSRKSAALGFTLIELLVVIVIIAVLVILSIMGYERYAASAAKVVSSGNLRQLQIANANYATEHNGRYVSSFFNDKTGTASNSWDTNQEFLGYYRGPSMSANSIEVPVNMLDPVAYKGKGQNRTKLRGSYGMPEVYGVTYGTPYADSSLKLTQLSAPERTASFVTGIDWHIVYGGRLKWDGTEGPVGRGIIAYRHGGKALVAYYDGHIGEISMADMKKFDGQGGKEHPFWKGF